MDLQDMEDIQPNPTRLSPCTSQPCRVVGAKMNLSPSEALTALLNAWPSSGNIYLSALGPHFAVAPASPGHGAEAHCGGGLPHTKPYPQGTCCETHGTGRIYNEIFPLIGLFRVFSTATSYIWDSGWRQSTQSPLKCCWTLPLSGPGPLPKPPVLLTKGCFAWQTLTNF